MEKLITVVELTPFIRAIQNLWTDSERLSFISYIAENYKSGTLIQGLGGLRKIRWKRPGIGKRGGVRIIYYYYDQLAPVYLITAYAKNEKENLTPEDKLHLTALIDQLKQEILRKRSLEDDEK